MVYCAVPATISGSNQPDGWYQGVVSFDDGIWSKNISTGESKNVLSRFGADIMNIFVSDDENHLIFTDKNGGNTMELEVKRISVIICQAMERDNKIYEINYLMTPLIPEDKVAEDVAVFRKIIEDNKGFVVGKTSPRRRNCLIPSKNLTTLITAGSSFPPEPNPLIT